MTDIKDLKGALGQSLARNSKQIKLDRAMNIHRTGEKEFRRRIEDLDDRIINLSQERDSLLDMSPDDANKLTIGTDFRASEFYEAVRKFTLQIRETKVELDEMKAQYEYIFGQKIGTASTVTAE